MTRSGCGAVAQAADLSHLHLYLPHHRGWKGVFRAGVRLSAKAAETKNPASISAGLTIPISRCWRTGWPIWDEAEDNLVFASGMAAISTTLWAYARPGTVISPFGAGLRRHGACC